ncbi:hypothetical protein HPB47_007938 [Ixodes persulcatus]|uniref:Uncharacterized protein n=1 Tax=Ixodes persulcatus TaxID=34615 RepID=A0AC60P711_IXOPE|nr:hypothetical protein HPB47_007938 [Ixodes persulcatus]
MPPFRDTGHFRALRGGETWAPKSSPHPGLVSGLGRTSSSPGSEAQLVRRSLAQGSCAVAGFGAEPAPRPRYTGPIDGAGRVESFDYSQSGRRHWSPPRRRVPCVPAVPNYYEPQRPSAAERKPRPPSSPPAQGSLPAMLLKWEQAATNARWDKEYLCIQASDTPGQNLTQFFSQSNDFIHHARIEGGNVLIHCLAGVSRSVTIAVAYVMSVTSLNWRESLKAVRGARSIANPNFGFQKQLHEYECKKLYEERKRLRQKFPRESFFDDEQECRKLLVAYHNSVRPLEPCPRPDAAVVPETPSAPQPVTVDFVRPQLFDVHQAALT